MVTVRWVIHSHNMLLAARVVKDEHPSDKLLHHGPASCLMLQVFPTSSVYLEGNGSFYRHTDIPGFSLGSILASMEEPVPLLSSQSGPF